MNKKCTFKYGKTLKEFKLPDKADILAIKEPGFCITREKFENDLLLAGLPENPSEYSAVCIVIADKTRLCDYKKYLPWLVEILDLKGFKNQNITFFIAYGTHAKQSNDQCLDAYGPVYEKYRFIHHDCTDKTLFTYLGKTARGTDIHIREEIVKSDLIITFGALSHHYFAGYGGGRKLLFPGLGYRPDIYQNHRLFLDTDLKILSSGCCPGNLEDNPLAMDLKQIDDAVKPRRISIHGILDSKARVCRLMVGKSYDDFLSACKHLDQFYKNGSKKLYDLVIASCGGFPKDINFIQAHKAINNAAMFVKDRGTLVVFAQCVDGIGSDTFIEYFNYHSFNKAFDVLEKEYKGNGGTALSMMSKTKRINILLKTDLDHEVCRKTGVTKADDTKIYNIIKNNQKEMACIENASLLIR